MEQLEQKIKNKTARVGIVGLGYVGLPLALAFADAGFNVLGFDVQKERADSVNQGKSYIVDVSDERLSGVLAGGRLTATTDQSRLSKVDAICICVPTPLTKTKQPDLSYVIHMSEAASTYLQPGQLIVLESTTYPGTTRGVLQPIFERSGLKAGQGFYLAYSPERVDPGNRAHGIENTPKLVGGLDPLSLRLVTLLYQQICQEVVPVSSPEVAEMTKIFENVFRNVNIALVNELAMLCENMDISVWEVIEAASSKPFGYMPFYPGPGVGGHCIPKDPYYLSSKAREYDFHTRFIELAAEVNERTPYRVASRVMEILNSNGKSVKNARLLVLGVAFKKDVEDIRDSPALKLVRILREKGAEVAYNDPYVASVKIGEETLVSTELTGETLAAADCVIIATDHSSYDYRYITANTSIVFDTRGVTRKIAAAGNVIRLGEGTRLVSRVGSGAEHNR